MTRSATEGHVTDAMIVAAQIDAAKQRLRYQRNPRRVGSLDAALAELADLLWDAGRRDECVETQIEIVNLYALAVFAEPGRYHDNHRLRAAVLELEGGLEATGRWERGADAIEAAVEACRKGLDDGWVTYRSWLAAVLTSQSALLAGVGRRDEALAAARESVALAEAALMDGAAALGGRQRRDNVALSIICLADLLDTLDRREDAVAVVAQAVIRMRPIPGGPAEFGLGKLLANHRDRLMELARFGEAVAAGTDAINVLRAVAWSEPEWLGALYEELRAQAALLGDLGMSTQARLAVAEAEQVWYRLDPVDRALYKDPAYQDPGGADEAGLGGS